MEKANLDKQIKEREDKSIELEHCIAGSEVELDVLHGSILAAKDERKRSLQEPPSSTRSVKRRATI